jgi:hypothetical protein
MIWKCDGPIFGNCANKISRYHGSFLIRLARPALMGMDTRGESDAGRSSNIFSV